MQSPGNTVKEIDTTKYKAVPKLINPISEFSVLFFTNANHREIEFENFILLSNRSGNI